MGNKVQAFYIAEFARQMFEDEEFTSVFHEVAAVKFDESLPFKKEEELNKYCQTHPDSIEAYIQALYQKIKGSTPEQNNVDQLIEKALTKYPRHVAIKAMAAKYYPKTKKDEEKAPPLYIDLYFYAPHFYGWEYVEF
jgi:hypothetical protein